MARCSAEDIVRRLSLEARQPGGTGAGPRLRYHSRVRVVLALGVFFSLITVHAAQKVAAPPPSGAVPAMFAQGPLDREAERWVAQTLAKLSLDDRVGQLMAPAFDSTYLPTDSDEFDKLTRVIRDSHAGAVIAFGGTELSPQVMLNPGYGTVVLGHPLSLAATLNQLQAVASVPLLATADFEYGRGDADCRRHSLSASDGAWRDRRRAAGVRGGTHHRRRGPGDGCARELCAGGRRQQQPAQSGHQHALVRRGSAACRRHGRCLRQGPAAGRDAGHVEALSRARRYRNRFTPRAAAHPAPARAVRRHGIAAVSSRHRCWCGRHDGGAHLGCRRSIPRRGRPPSAAP